jgi:hypothetical protein
MIHNDIGFTCSISRQVVDGTSVKRIPEARTSYEKALALTRQEPERRFLGVAAPGIEIKEELK